MQGRMDTDDRTEEGEDDDIASYTSHLGLRFAPQIRQAHSKQGKGHAGKSLAVCSVTATVTPENGAQSSSCPGLPQLQTTFMTVSCRKQMLGPSRYGKHFPVNPRCFLPTLLLEVALWCPYHRCGSECKSNLCTSSPLCSCTSWSFLGEHAPDLL